MRERAFYALVLQCLLAVSAAAQNFPDRVVNYDPLGKVLTDSGDVVWLGTVQPHFEFARYSNGSGRSHRWNGKLGGFLEVVRWDSTWSIAYMTTAETIIDPNNSIGFNPRAVFWEEGVLVSRRLHGDAAAQFGVMQRCKHDVDNLEHFYATGVPQERTLIFTSATLRLLVRPHVFIESLPWLRGAVSARSEYYIHLLDHRIPDAANESGRHLDRSIATTVFGGRLEARPVGRRFGVHLSSSAMVNITGGRINGNSRFDNVAAMFSVPHLELGLDLFNPNGVGVTVFARGEWQRDAGILPDPAPATLVLFGVRATDIYSVW